MSALTIARVASAVFRETVRDRVLYGIVGFAILVIGASLLLSQLTAGQDVKIIKDLGLAAMSLFGLFIAVFVGIGLVSREVERRSVYSLLAKPVLRSEVVLGKYAGLVFTLAVNLAVMTAVWYMVLTYEHWIETAEFRRGWEAPATDPRMLIAVYLILVQLALVVAIAVFFSTFSSPILSAALTLALFVAGHFTADLKQFDAVVGESPVRHLTTALYYVLPDMAAFDVKTAVVHAVPVTAGYVFVTSLYGFCYIAALLAAGVLIFSRRDFK